MAALAVILLTILFREHLPKNHAALAAFLGIAAATLLLVALEAWYGLLARIVLGDGRLHYQGFWNSVDVPVSDVARVTVERTNQYSHFQRHGDPHAIAVGPDPSASRDLQHIAKA